MLPTQTAIYPRLFQTWRPCASPGQPTEHSSDYIELPAVSSYEALARHETFPAIQTQFLGDIQKLRHLAHNFVEQKYDGHIDSFRNRLKTPPEDLRGQDHLLPLYRETRFQIRQLVMALENQQHASADQQAYIAARLHDCLNDIDQCPAGVHSRFANCFINLAADRAGLAGRLFQVRQQLFHEFIASFLFVQQREGLMDIPSGMEVHWFNSLHNLHCDALALLSIADPRAPTTLCGGLIERFLAEVNLSVNACAILRKFSSQWSDLLSTTLHELGIAAWETDTIAPAEITADRTAALNSKLFEPVNHLLKTTGKQSLDLWTMVEENDDGSYRLDRYREKLLAWMSIHFCGPAATVFAVIPAAGAPCQYIATIGELFFWVSAHSPSLHAGQPCTFDTNNHTTLTLAHLTTIDFTTWPDNTSHALLTQAMQQTDDAEDIASFFLHHNISAQLIKTPQPVVQKLSHQLTEKLAHNPGDFQKRLCRCVCDQLAEQRPVSSQALHWLMGTPLLEPVLSAVYRQTDMDTRPFTQHLATWHICGFTQENLNKLLTRTDCQRLFGQALDLGQAQILSSLLSTGHCDQQYCLLNNKGKNLLAFFACKGILPGLKYLLQFLATDVNRLSPHGTPPLGCAAQFGHLDCLKALLAVAGIRVNQRNSEGRTALHLAVYFDFADCVRALLAAKGIQINAKTNSGWRAIDLAARHGRRQCLEALLESGVSGINDKNPFGYTPLASAARSNHADCVKVLLGVPGILVNIENNEGWTPLLCAITFAYVDCVRTLLTSESVEVNAIASAGWTPLCCAARFGQTECLKILLDKEGIEVNLRNGDNLSPLDNSVLFGHAECTSALLATPGCRVNDRGPEGETPLCSAARNGFEACVRALLLADDIQVNAITDSGWTAFSLAAKHGHPGCLKALLDTGCIDIHGKNPNNYTALGSAAMEGHTACVNVLLGADGIDVNLDSNGWTPLQLAARNGNLECLKALLASIAIEVNSEGQAGETALTLASRYAHPDCVKALLARPDVKVNPRIELQCNFPLHHAARFGDARWIGALRAVNEQQLNERDQQGCTPLDYAAAAGHAQCIEALLATGMCHVNKESSFGYTPLGSAARLGYTASIRVLLGADGIDVNLKDRHGWTPLHYAASNGHAECIEILLAANGCRFNEQSTDGSTPLISATQAGHSDCVRILLNARGIEVNVENNQGITALLYAAMMGYAECVQVLLKADSIQVSNRATMGWTPLCGASRFGHANCVRALLAANDIDVNIGSDKSCTPLHFAAGHGHTDCVKLLLGTDGIQVNLKSSLGRTPLDYAVEYGITECIEALIKVGGVQRPPGNGHDSSSK